MSDSEEENFCYFGKPLQPYDEDAFPKKKPITVEEQIATDAQGRRRFHGAFTGGFSAGFFNTVGSLEGWTPSEFKSTRQDKAKGFTQRPEDFMDEEDTGEYGIAPQVVKATSDYSTSRKRKKQVFTDGPIPGEPVLHSLLTSGNETVGYLLLKNMGIQDKMNEQKIIQEERVYGCEMPKTYEIPKSVENKQYLVPEIYKKFLEKPKSNTFGLGYQGLDKGNINLFQNTNFVVSDKNKKLSIQGQAFGVGAFEEDDDDIYMKEDMSKYDFELTSEKKGKPMLKPKQYLVFDMFVQSKMPLINKKQFPPPTIPQSFTGKHKTKRSRFAPLPEESENVERKDINPAIRAKYLGENTKETYTPSKPIIDTKQALKKPDEKKQDNSSREEGTVDKKGSDFMSALLLDKFVSSSEKEDVTNILEPVKKSETLHGTEQMRDAVKMKMYGPLTRITTDWAPCALLCKRFNVPEPFMDRPERQRKRTKNLIFEQQKHTDDIPDLKPGLSMQDDKKSVELVEEPKEIHNLVSIKSEIEVESTPQTEENLNSITEKEDDVTETVILTDLPKDITDRVDVEKKVDLFKAVFLSSSESESEEETISEEKNNRDEEMKTSVLSEPLIPKIKPIKEGILSNVNFHSFTKPLISNTADGSNDKYVSSEAEVVTANSDIKQNVDNLYGPRIPEILPVRTTPIIKVESSDSEDRWVEKDDNGRKHKHKKEKKSKKAKHKKHKREKKKRH